MGFTHLLSRLKSGEAHPPFYLDEKFAVASINKIQKILSNRVHFNLANVKTVDRPSVAVKTNTLFNCSIPSGEESSMAKTLRIALKLI